MTTRLDLYNMALLEIGERELASLTEDREPRRVLDQVWNTGFVDYVLKNGQWKFAKRTIEMANEPSITPGFGYSKAYTRPSDLVRITGITSDEYGQNPLTAYAAEGAYFFADVEPFYLSYVSNNASYGGDLSRWPSDFTLYAHTYLAMRVCKRLTQDKSEFDRLVDLGKKRLSEAKSADAMEGPTIFPPAGSFVRARQGSARGDRGSRSSLIG